MKKFIGLIYMIWPAIFWMIWGGMNHLGYSGWVMDLLFVGAITVTVLAVALAVFVGLFISRH